MDDVRLGRLLRAVRRRNGLRQIDVAAAAGVSQQTISVLELGHLDHISIPVARRIATALQVSIEISARWRGASGDRLLDAAHARLVESVVAELKRTGFDAIPEYTFNHFGERGSVDVVGWHAARRALLIVEVKSELVDTQAVNSTLDRKVRVVPKLLAEERGWVVESIGRVLVLPDRTSTRDAVSRHRATFAAALPGRNRAVAAWLRMPVGTLNAIWFVRSTSHGGGSRVGGREARRNRS